MDHNNLTDAEFLSLFKRNELDPRCFDHMAHLRLAYLYIQRFGLHTAISEVCKQLKAFTEKQGEPEKYNETVTTAAVRAVNHFMNKSRATQFKSFIKSFPKLRDNLKELLSQHYGIDIYNSEIAKSTFLQPDLQPFD